MYCHLYCGSLPEKNYSITIDWIDPFGAVQGQTVDQYAPSSPNGIYQKLFKVNLPKNGHVNRMLTGRKYSDDLYGSWKYYVYLNGKRVAEGAFTVH